MAKSPAKPMLMPPAPKVTKAKTITPTSAKTKMGQRAAGRPKMPSSPQVRANQRKPNG